MESNTEEIVSKLKEVVRDFPDFPSKGVLFRDICPILKNPSLYDQMIKHMANQVKDLDFTHLVALEARGFLFATPLSPILNKPVVLVRKTGKLPGPTIQYSYEKEYGKDTVEIQSDALDSNSKCLIVDDLLATGGTLIAASELVKKAGGTIAGFLLLIELQDLKGREKVTKYTENMFVTLQY